jgi:hypothetical protein
MVWLEPDVNRRSRSPVNTAIFDFDPASGEAVLIDLVIHRRQRRRTQSELVDALVNPD